MEGLQCALSEAKLIRVQDSGVQHEETNELHKSREEIS